MMRTGNGRNGGISVLLEEDRHYLERLVGLYHNYGEDVGSAEMQRIAGGMLERLHSGALGREDYAWLLARVRNQMEAVAGMGDPEDPERKAFLDKCGAIAARLAAMEAH